MNDEHRIERSVVVIGGGFSGAALARALVDRSVEPLILTVVEPRADLGAGLAYSTTEPGHLLNGPAAMFSLHADRPSHFADWIVAHVGPEIVASWTDGDDVFAPRSFYGRYVSDELRTAVERAKGRVVFRHVQARAAALRPGPEQAVVVLEDGRELAADHVVLASGVPASRPAFETDAVRAHAGYLADAWDLHGYARSAEAERVAIIGSGLTMLDSLVSLERAGFKGQVEVVSRRGLSVWTRRGAQPWPAVIDPADLPTSAREVLRAAQRARRQVARSGADWQALPPAIAPLSGAIWAGADDVERRRYLRHLRTFWEITRHRAAPPTGRLGETLRRDGRVRQRAGRVEAIVPGPDGLTVMVRARAQAIAEPLPVDGIINCTGAEFDIRKAAFAQPFLARLLRDGVVRPGPVSFGLDAEKNGTVRDVNGAPQDRLSALGPLLRGVHWESNALPEILPQVAALAKRLAKHERHALEPL